MMVYLAMTAVALVSIVATAVTVLVRRDRRRMAAASPEAQRIEAAATRDFRDARRQAHGYEHFSDASGGISALRDRDSR